MSWHHFLDTNKNRLLDDLTDINNNNSEDIWQTFYQRFPYTNQLDICLQNLQEQFSQELIVANYWKYKVRKYYAPFQESANIYPLVFSTQNLIQAHQLDINYFDGMNTSDTLKLYTQDKMESYDVLALMQGSWSEGIAMEVQWKNKVVDQENDILQSVIASGKKTDRLGELNPLWKLLDNESWIQKKLVNPQ